MPKREISLNGELGYTIVADQFVLLMLLHSGIIHFIDVMTVGGSVMVERRLSAPAAVTILAVVYVAVAHYKLSGFFSYTEHQHDDDNADR